MMRAIIDKRVLIEKNTIQVNRLLGDKEEVKLNEDTDLLFENAYLFPFAKFEKGEIIELTEEESKLKGLMKLQSNEVILNNKVITLEYFEKVVKGKIVIDEELKKEHLNKTILYLKSERVKLKKEKKDFLEFEEDTTELDIRIGEITKELEKLEKELERLK